MSKQDSENCRKLNPIQTVLQSDTPIKGIWQQIKFNRTSIVFFIIGFIILFLGLNNLFGYKFKINPINYFSFALAGIFIAFSDIIHIFARLVYKYINISEMTIKRNRLVYVYRVLSVIENTLFVLALCSILVLPLFIQYNVEMDSISNSVTTISMGLVIISLCLKENMNTNSQIISRDIRLALADELIKSKQNNE